MLELILMLTLSPLQTPAPVAQVRTCVWPNTCKSEVLAQVQTCVWPKTCKDAAPAPAANKCA